MKLDPKRFVQIIEIKDPVMRNIQLSEFCAENKLKTDPQEFIEIAQMFCAIYSASQPELTAACAVIEVM
jgi:hypothetical protein